MIVLAQNNDILHLFIQDIPPVGGFFSDAALWVYLDIR